MRNRFTALLSLALLFLPPALAGKEPKNALKGLDLTQRYLVLDTARKGAETLNQAGAAGYRFVVGNEVCEGSIGADTEYRINCERRIVMGKGAPERVAYQFIDLNGPQERLNEAASQGFRLVPYYSECDEQEDRLVGLMEKSPISDSRYQYLVLRAEKASALLGDVNAAAQKGYGAVLFSCQRRGCTAVLEKAAAAEAEVPLSLEDASRQAPTARYLMVFSEKELASASGYCRGAAGLLEKLPGVGQGCEYVTISPRWIGMSKTPEKKMNEAAAKGFRYWPRTTGFTLAMERRSGSTALYQYRILATFRLSTMRKELAEAVQQGYEVVGALPFPEGQALILERPRGPGEP